MMYVDENLCTGCGLCVDACESGALSVRGRSAVIDAALCTGCGRCAPLCMTGAIGRAEIIPVESPSFVPDRRREAPPDRSGTSLSPSFAPAHLDTARTVLSGVLWLVEVVLDRRARRVPAGKGLTQAAAGQCRRRSGGRGRGMGSRGEGRGGAGRGGPRNRYRCRTGV